jgi:hypothetical protein
VTVHRKFLPPLCVSKRNRQGTWIVNIFVFPGSRSRSYVTTDYQSISMSWCRAHSGTCDLILLPVEMLLFESCSLVSVGRPLWREDRFAVCSAITQWSESRRTLTIRYSPIWDSPNLKVQVLIFISPRNRVAQLYPLELSSLYVASYDSQGYGGCIRTRLHMDQEIWNYAE